VEPEPAEAQPETSEESAAPAEGLAGGAALSQAATFAAEDEPSFEATAPPEAPAEPEPETATGTDTESTSEARDVDVPAEEEQDAPQPTSNGATHTPRTDVDITETDSLFDL
jgi:hypothetical protein